MTTWTYPACVVVGVHDGDTIEVDIDLGQDMWVRRRAVRLFGIAARELAAPGGREARDHLAGLLPLGASVEVYSTGWDKYAGRIDGRVTHADGDRLLDVGVEMIASGYAAPWNGSGKQPQPPWPIPTPLGS